MKKDVKVETKKSVKKTDKPKAFKGHCMDCAYE